MATILAVLTNSDGSIVTGTDATGTVGAYAANPDGSAPALIAVPGPQSQMARVGPFRPSVLALPADYYALNPPQVPLVYGLGLSTPGDAQPGLASPGFPGAAQTRPVYAYSYVYSQPVLTAVGGQVGSR